MRRTLLILAPAWALVVPMLAACSRNEPPTWDAAGESPSVAPLPSSLGAPSPSASVAAAPASTSARPVASAAPAKTGDAGDADPGSLPQTEDKPAASGPAFEARVAALWDAIVSDDPERAMPFFFPVGAYQQVKDIPKPENDWKRRLVAAYRRDIHAMHKRLGDNAASAKLVRFDVPEARAKWVKPNEELNKIGYYRVFGTKIRYEDGGRERHLDVMSLISWRGEWYVVHLSGFK